MPRMIYFVDTTKAPPTIETREATPGVLVSEPNFKTWAGAHRFAQDSVREKIRALKAELVAVQRYTKPRTFAQIKDRSRCVAIRDLWLDYLDAHGWQYLGNPEHLKRFEQGLKSEGVLHPGESIEIPRDPDSDFNFLAAIISKETH